jgi:GNAT superfamily N-acetyltransferase
MSQTAMDKNGRSVEVKQTSLEMATPADLKPYRSDDDRIRIQQAKECPASFFRYLYAEVGRKYHWVDRLGWTDDEIRAYLADPAVSLWVIYYDGSPAGYFELKKEEGGSTELAYFGLLEEFIGRGLGKHLLSFAIERAWGDGARRVWVHTCTLDGPTALPNYLKRGFKPFDEETYFVTLSDDE